MSSPRSRSITGQLLPSPRLVSTTVHYDIDVPHVRYSLLVMQFGQFLDHEITMTPLSEGSCQTPLNYTMEEIFWLCYYYLKSIEGFEGSILDCKRCDSRERVHQECYPITIPEDDAFYPSVNEVTGERKCLSFTRSMPGQLTLGLFSILCVDWLEFLNFASDEAKLFSYVTVDVPLAGFRQQMNQITAYIDASGVYGSDKCDARKLRLFQRGQLNTTRSRYHGRKPMLPETSSNHECKSPSGLCFEAGETNQARIQKA